MGLMNRLFGRGKQGTKPTEEATVVETDSSSPRRLPIYLLLHVSDSMTGAPIQAVNAGVNLLYNELIKNRSAVEMVHIAVIAFDSQAKIVVPLIPLTQFNPPVSSAGAGTSLGAALRLMNESLDHDIHPSTPDQKGDFKPLIFLMISGVPADDWEHEASVLRKKDASVIALGYGGGVDVAALRRITEAVLLIGAKPEAEQAVGTMRHIANREYAELVHESMSIPTQDLVASITRYFKWVSQSVLIAIASLVSNKDSVLPPPSSGIQVVL